MQNESTGRGPVRREERALAPDLARGSMLLLIALANAAGAAFGGAPGFEPSPHGLERGANLLLFTFVHARTYPVFAVLFGYGLVQLATRQAAAGASPRRVRAVLLRRNAWLVVFGLAHATLLYFGDFLGAYGLVGMVATVVLLGAGRRVDRALLAVWGLTTLHLGVLAARVVSRWRTGAGAAAPLPFEAVASLGATDYATSLRDRLAEWPVHTATVLPFVLIVWLGMWAARRRLLEEPAAHRALLVRIAGGGLGTAVLGAVPLALASAGLLHGDAHALSAMLVLQEGSGMFGGPGYVALFGLLALGLTARASEAGSQSRVARALAALGQRSLSAYLFQSLAWLALLAPFGAALPSRSGSPLLCALAVAALVWLSSVAAAVALERAGSRGPAEVLLRRLTYGAAGRARGR